MRGKIILLALALAGCATQKAGEYRRLGEAPVECYWAPIAENPLGADRVQCRMLGDPTTAKTMVLGEHGVELRGEVRGIVGVTP